MVANSNHKDTKEMILARFELWFLQALMEIWPDENGVPGITQKYLATKCKISPRSVAYYLSGERTPDMESLRSIGEFFGIHFVLDWDNSIDMQKLLERIKAFIPPAKAS